MILAAIVLTACFTLCISRALLCVKGHLRLFTKEEKERKVVCKFSSMQKAIVSGDLASSQVVLLCMLYPKTEKCAPFD